MSTLLHLLVLLHTVVLTNANDHDPSTSEVCTTPQYLRVGETGVIECQFGNFYSVYWYNSTDSEKENPLVAMKDSLKTGEGYESGQFDVFPNGSFIIRTVSLLHDHSFRVIMLKNKDGDDYVIRDIDVHVIVASHQPHPYINICGQKAFCFAKLGENYQIDCTVNETRPAANLTWAQRRHTLSDQDVPSEEVTVQRNTMYSATSKTMTKFEELQTALLLVCKVSGPPHVISKSESMVFIENIDKEYPSVPKLTKNSEIGKKLTLACSTSNKSFVIWKKKSKTDEWTSIITVVFEDHVCSKVYVDDYTHDEDGSLIISQVGTDDEGSYMCIYSTSEAEKAQVIEVVLFDLPDPPYLVVEGCTPSERCVLEVQREGNLTCSVKGIRPNVRLDWLPFPEDFTMYISFFDRQEVIEGNGDTYDISVTSRYTLKDGDQNKLGVECRVSNWDNTMLELDKKLELHFTSDIKSGSNTGPIWLVILLIPLLVVAIIVGTVIRNKRKRGSKKSSTGSEEGEKAEDVENSELMQNQDTTNIDEEEQKQKSDEKTIQSSTGHHQSDAVATQNDSGEDQYKQIETNDITKESSSTTDEVREHPEKKDVSSDSKNVSVSLKNSEERVKGTMLQGGTDDFKNTCEYETNGKEVIDATPGNNDKEQYFQNQLKLKYKHLYTVLPVPGLSKEKKCVNDFFVQRDFEHSDTKKEFQSHHDLFSLPLDGDEPPRLHLKGSGKLTLILQLAYEWCEARDKYKTDFETFIFLNLRDFKGELSLYKTIKDVLVPDSKLNEKDIEEIMETYGSGLLILYGLGESPYNVESDVGKVISSDVLQNFHVMFTTPDDGDITTEEDFEAQKVIMKELNKKFFTEYIMKNVVQDNDTIEKIITNFHRAPYLHNLCKIPLVFAMYAFVCSTKGRILETATDVFENALLPSEKSQKRRKKDQNRLLKEEGILAKLTFDCLISNKEEKFWFVEELILHLGKDIVTRYEESGLLIRCNAKSDDSSSFRVKEGCKFRHKIIFDWYVACHFRQLKKDEVKISATKIALLASENVFCFICGINQHYAETVIKTLQHQRKIKPQLLIFCLLEQEQAGGITGTADIVQKQFKPRITFTKQDTSLYQKSLRRLLISKIASNFKDNGIKTLTINECLKSNDHSKNHLSLVSGVQIPPLDFVEYLEIELPGQKLKDIQAILEYAASCQNLKKIVFDSCLLPNDFTGYAIPDKYEKNEIKVEWQIRRGLKTLTFPDCTWKDKMGGELSAEGYYAIVKLFQPTQR